MEKREANRHSHLLPEVIEWVLLTREVINAMNKKRGKISFPAGGLVAGRVLVTNQYGASWTMTVEEFDATYKAR